LLCKVTTVSNYSLFGEVHGEKTILDVTYDSITRTVELTFDPLDADRYQLVVSTRITSAEGARLPDSFVSEFDAVTNFTALVDIEFANPRSDRLTETISYDVILTNIDDHALLLPLSLVVTPKGTFEGQPLNAFDEQDGAFFIDLSTNVLDGVLEPGESTTIDTITLTDPNSQRVFAEHDIFAVPTKNARPVFTSDPVTSAVAGGIYSYQANAFDPDDNDVTFILGRGPEGLAVDSITGLITWLPTEQSPTLADVILHAFDERGGSARQVFSIEVSGVNKPPVLSGIPGEILGQEGDLLQVAVAALDPECDRVLVRADHFPPGASFDPLTSTLSWIPGPDAAGIYEGVSFLATDPDGSGREVMVSTTMRVLPSNQPPVFEVLGERTLREGDSLNLQLIAEDPDGDRLTFSSDLLPRRALLFPDSGLFRWLPGFSQEGVYDIPFTVEDGQNIVSQILTITVLNANAAPVFDPIGTLRVLEGQNLNVRAFALDPDNPDYIPQFRVFDEITPPEGMDPTVTYEAAGLPEGATFDEVTGILDWTPDFDDVGEYLISITATDDGNGTGLPLFATMDVQINVENANRAPLLDSLDNQSVARFDSLEIAVNASDGDGNPITLSASNAFPGFPLPDFLSFSDNGDGTGLLRAEPGFGDRGDYTIVVTAFDDGDGGGDTQILPAVEILVLTVSSANEPPVMAFVGDKVAVVGEPFELVMHVSDMDEDPLAFTSVGLPAGASLGPGVVYGTAVLTWTPAAGDIGTHTLTVKVQDSGNGDATEILSDEQIFDIAVRSTNTAPVLVPVGDQVVDELDTLTIELVAIDEEGDTVTYGAEGLPLGAVLDAENGVITWTPNIFQQGVYPSIIITASDGHGSTSETITLEVSNRNQAPILVNLPDQSSREGIPLHFDLSAGDIDGDPLTYRIDSGFPSGAVFNVEKGTFDWTPDFDQEGEHVISVVVEDSGGLTDSIDVTVIVDNVNRGPELSESNHAVLVGQLLQFFVSATDPDLETTLEFFALGLPDGASIDPATGEFVWVPSPGQTGEFVVLLAVDDGEAITSQAIVIESGIVLEPPHVVIELTPSFPASVGNPVIVNVIATSLAKIASVVARVEGTPLALDENGRAEIASPSAGRRLLEVVVTDVDGRTTSVSEVIKTRDPNDVDRPIVSIDAALEGDALTGSTAVIGTILDTNLDQWTLSLTRFGSRDFRLLASGSESGSDQMLTTLDPTLLANGFYTLRLSAVDISGRQSVDEVTIDVNTVDKPEQYLRQESDLVLDLDGVLVDLIREYDSLERDRDGTLGFGWRFTHRNLRLETNVNATGRENFGSYNPFEVGTRLYLTLPEGRRTGFTLTPESTETPGLTYVIPKWQADPGVDFLLESVSAKLIVAGDRLYDLNTGRPYHPASDVFEGHDYALTGPDGFKYYIDGERGVERIDTADGGQLLVADGSIVNVATGAEARLVTNDDGRISVVMASDGEQVRFTYDERGDLTAVRSIFTASSTRYGYDPEDEHLLVLGITPPDQDSEAILFNSAPAVVPVLADLGPAAQFSRAVVAGELLGGETDRFVFSLRESELLSTANGRVLLGVSISADTGSGLRPGLPVIHGLDPLASNFDDSSAFGLYSLDRAGLHLLEVSGSDAVTNGPYSLELSVSADANQDGNVNGVDSQLLTIALGSAVGDEDFRPAADANGDGLVDSVDVQILSANLGFLANRVPEIRSATLSTHEDLEIVISLDDLVEDPENDSVFFRLLDATGGSMRIGADGESVVFAPAPGFTGGASFVLEADDGFGSAPATVFDVAISDAPLMSLDFLDRNPKIAPGHSQNLRFIGNFADQVEVELAASYLTLSTTNEAASVSQSGLLRGLSDGTGAIIAERDGLRAATAFQVGAGLALSADRVDNILVSPNNIRLSNESGTAQLAVGLPSGEDVSAAADGTLYFSGDETVAEVSADGFVSAVGDGSTIITVIHGAAEALLPVTVESPQGSPATVGPEGGVVVSSGEITFGIPDGALALPTVVAIELLQEDALPAPLIAPFELVAGFILDIGDQVLAVRPQLEIAVPGATPAGSRIVVLKFGVTRDEKGDLIDTWFQTDIGTVGDDSMARLSSSFPTAGIRESGEYWIVYAPADQIGTVVADVTPTNPVLPGAQGFISVFFDTVAPNQEFPSIHEGEEPPATDSLLIGMQVGLNYLTSGSVPGEILRGMGYSQIDVGIILPHGVHVVRFNELVDIETQELPEITTREVRVLPDAVARVETAIPTLKRDTDAPIIHSVAFEIYHFGTLDTATDDGLKPAVRVEVENLFGTEATGIENVTVHFRELGTYVNRAVTSEGFEYDADAGELVVPVPHALALGLSEIIVRRDTVLAGKQGVSSTFSNPARIELAETGEAAPRYLFVAGLASVNPAVAVGVFDTSLEAGEEDFIAKIALTESVAGKRPQPTSVALSRDGTRGYVPLGTVPGIAVIDTIALQQIDASPGDGNIDPVDIIELPEGARPFWAVVDRANKILFVTDRRSAGDPRDADATAYIYWIDIDPSKPTYHRHIRTTEVGPAPLGLRQLDVSSDNRWLFAAAPGTNEFLVGPQAGVPSRKGHLLVVNIDETSPKSSVVPPKPDPYGQQIGKIEAGLGTYGVEATGNASKILFTDRAADFNGFGVAIFEDDISIKLLRPNADPPPGTDRTSSSDGRPEFTWKYSDRLARLLKENSQNKVELFVSTYSEGEGLFPKDLKDVGVPDKFNRGRILNGVDVLNRVGITEEVKFKLPEDRTLTQGQTYYWGLKVTLKQSIGEDIVLWKSTKFFELSAPSTGAGHFSSVTLLTHGLSVPYLDTDVPDDYLDLGNLIADRGRDGETEPNTGAVLKYQPSDGTWEPAVKGVNSTAEEARNSGEPLVLISNWVADSGINDSGFAEAAADALFTALVSLDLQLGGKSTPKMGKEGELDELGVPKVTLGPIFTSPIHLIGFSRGASVNSEIAQRLIVFREAHPPEEDATNPEEQGSNPDDDATEPKKKAKFPDLQMTTLDPHDFGLHDSDPEMAKLSQNYLQVNLGPIAQLAEELANLALTFSVEPISIGLSVAARVATSLAKQGLNLLQLNTLDFRDFLDPNVTVWKGIGFADNYYQEASSENLVNEIPGTNFSITFTPNGRAISGADLNIPLNSADPDESLPFDQNGDRRSGFKDSIFDGGGPHQRVKWWYAGTVGLDLDFFPTGTKRDLVPSDNSEIPNVELIYRRPEHSLDGAAATFALNEQVGEINPEVVFDAPAKQGRFTILGYGLGDTIIRPWYTNKEPEEPKDITVILKDNETPDPLNAEVFEGILEGWFYSLLGGGEGQRPKSEARKNSEAEEEGRDNEESRDGPKLTSPLFDNTEHLPGDAAIPTVFNGNFDASVRPVLGRFPVLDFHIPGWSFHNGAAAKSPEESYAKLLETELNAFGSVFDQEIDIPFSTDGLNLHKIQRLEKLQETTKPLPTPAVVGDKSNYALRLGGTPTWPINEDVVKQVLQSLVSLIVDTVSSLLKQRIPGLPDTDEAIAKGSVEVNEALVEELREAFENDPDLIEEVKARFGPLFNDNWTGRLGAGDPESAARSVVENVESADAVSILVALLGGRSIPVNQELIKEKSSEIAAQADFAAAVKILANTLISLIPKIDFELPLPFLPPLTEARHNRFVVPDSGSLHIDLHAPDLGPNDNDNDDVLEVYLKLEEIKPDGDGSDTGGEQGGDGGQGSSEDTNGEEGGDGSDVPGEEDLGQLLGVVNIKYADGARRAKELTEKVLTAGVLSIPIVGGETFIPFLRGDHPFFETFVFPVPNSLRNKPATLIFKLRSEDGEYKELWLDNVTFTSPHLRAGVPTKGEGDNKKTAKSEFKLEKSGATVKPVAQTLDDFGTDYFLERAEYALSYNGDTNNPNWVAWNMSPVWPKLKTRPQLKFNPDPLLPEGLGPETQEAVEEAYKSSQYDKGHQAASNHRTRTLKEVANTFYASNILPQRAAIQSSGGPWRGVENLWESLSRDDGSELHIFAGGLYKKVEEFAKGTFYPVTGDPVDDPGAKFVQIGEHEAIDPIVFDGEGNITEVKNNLEGKHAVPSFLWAIAVEVNSIDANEDSFVPFPLQALTKEMVIPVPGEDQPGKVPKTWVRAHAFLIPNEVWPEIRLMNKNGPGIGISNPTVNSEFTVTLPGAGGDEDKYEDKPILFTRDNDGLAAFKDHGPVVGGVFQGLMNTWRVSVDRIEELTGYDFFSQLPDAVEDKVEAQGEPSPSTDGDGNSGGDTNGNSQEIDGADVVAEPSDHPPAPVPSVQITPADDKEHREAAGNVPFIEVPEEVKEIKDWNVTFQLAGHGQDRDGKPGPDTDLLLFDDTITPFDVNNATDIAILELTEEQGRALGIRFLDGINEETPEEELPSHVGFVVGYNEFIPDNFGHDPTMLTSFGRDVGGNIGVVLNPLISQGTAATDDNDTDAPKLIAATRPIELGFPESIELSQDQKRLYVGFRGLSAVFEYDIEHIIAALMCDDCNAEVDGTIVPHNPLIHPLETILLPPATEDVLRIDMPGIQPYVLENEKAGTPLLAHDILTGQVVDFVVKTDNEDDEDDNVSFEIIQTALFNDAGNLYRLVDPASGVPFAIDSVTGVVTVSDRGYLDYELFGRGSGPAFRIYVQATGPFGLTDIEEFDIHLENVIEAPFVADQVLMGPASAGGQELGWVRAQAAEPEGKLEFALSGRDSELFRIAGLVTVGNVGDAVIEAVEPLDAGVYELELEVKTVMEDPIREGPVSRASITVGIVESPMGFGTGPMPAVELVRTTPLGTKFELPRLTIDGQPAGTTLEYSLINGNEDGVFGIDSETGILSVVNRIPLDQPLVPSYDLVIQARSVDDVTGVPTGHRILLTRSITGIEGSIDLSLDDQSVRASRTTPLRARIARMRTSDSHPDPGLLVHYIIVAGDPEGMFALDPVTGVLMLQDRSILDSMPTATFNLEVKALHPSGLLSPDAAAVEVKFYNVFIKGVQGFLTPGGMATQRREQPVEVEKFDLEVLGSGENEIEVSLEGGKLTVTYTLKASNPRIFENGVGLREKVYLTEAPGLGRGGGIKTLLAERIDFGALGSADEGSQDSFRRDEFKINDAALKDVTKRYLERVVARRKTIENLEFKTIVSPMPGLFPTILLPMLWPSEIHDLLQDRGLYIAVEVEALEPFFGVDHEGRKSVIPIRESRRLNNVSSLEAGEVLREYFDIEIEEEVEGNSVVSSSDGSVAPAQASDVVVGALELRNTNGSEFEFNETELRMESSGLIDIGFLNTGVFRPLLQVDGTVWFTDDVIHAQGTTFALIPEISQPLFDGLWEIPIGGVTTTLLQEDSAVVDKFTVAGFAFDFSGFELVLPDTFGGVPSLRVAGDLHLPPSLGGGVLPIQGENALVFSADGVNLDITREIQDVNELMLGSLRLVPVEVTAELEQDAVGEPERLQLGGVYDLPELGSQVLLGTNSDSTLFLQQDSGAVSVAASLMVNTSRINPNWRLDEIVVDAFFDGSEWVVTGLGTLVGPDVATPVALSFGSIADDPATVGDESKQSVHIDFTDGNASVSFLGLGVPLENARFIADRSPDDTLDWDPEILFAGEVSLPESLTGGTREFAVARGLTFEVSQGVPFTVNSKGAGFNGDLLGLGPWEFDLFGALPTRVENAELSLNEVRQCFELRGDGAFSTLNDAAFSLAGDNYIQFSDEQGVRLVGDIVLADSVGITANGDWQIAEIVITQAVPGLLAGNVNLVHPGNATLNTELRISKGEIKLLPVVGEDSDFVISGFPVDFSEVLLLPDRTFGLGADTFDPELRISGSMNLPASIGGGRVELDGADVVVVNRDGAGFFGNSVSLPQNFELSLLGLADIAASNARIAFDAVDGSSLVGLFTIPGLRDAEFMLGEAGTTIVLRSSDHAIAADVATGLAPIPIFDDWALENVMLELSKAFEDDTASLVVRADLLLPGGGALPLTLEFADGVPQETSLISGVGVDFTLLGIDFDIRELFFVPDHKPLEGDPWDPSIAVEGVLTLPAELGATTLDLNQPHQFVITETGAQLVGGAVPLPNQIVDLLGIVRAEFTAVELDYRSQPSMFTLTGDVVLPDVFGVAGRLEGNSFIRLAEDESGEPFVDLQGVLRTDDILLEPGIWELRDVLFSADVTRARMPGSATMLLPPGIELDAELVIEDFALSEVTIDQVFDGDAPPIGVTGARLASLQGTLAHLDAGDPLPIALEGSASILAGPELALGPLPSWVPTTVPDENVFMLSADVVGIWGQFGLRDAAVRIEVLGGLVSGSGDLVLDWSRGRLDVDGQFSALDGLIVLESSFATDTSQSFTLGGAASVVLPSIASSALVGQGLGASEALIRFTNDDDLTNDGLAAWGTIESFLGNHTLGFDLHLDGSVDVITSESPLSPAGAGTFDVPAGTDRLLLTATWQTQRDGVEVRVTAPDGTVFTETDFDDVTIGEVQFLTSSTRRTVGISDPTAGEWSIEIVDDTGLGQVEHLAGIGSSAPTISITAPIGDVTDTSVTIEYDATDNDSEAQIAFYYDDNAEGLNGVLMVEGIAESDGAGSIVWDASQVAIGEYFIYAVVADANNAPVTSAYSLGKVLVSEAPPGDVSGTVFDDLNGNGLRDEGEPGIQGRTVFIDDNGDGALTAGESTLITGAGGGYSFLLKRQATYDIGQVIPADHVQSAPARTPTRTVTLHFGENRGGIDFGTFELAVVSGTVFDDHDNDGLLTPGESGIQGEMVFLDENANDFLDSLEVSTTTDESGRFEFTGLEAGSVRVVQEKAAGTATSSAHEFVISSGLRAENLDFANFVGGSLSGMVFVDHDGNGKNDAGDPGLGSVTLFLDGNGNRGLDRGEPSTVTDATGTYTFSGLPAGPYTIVQAVEAGFLRTLPQDTDSYSVTIATSGQSVTDLDFGNRAPGLLNGGFLVEDPTLQSYGWNVRGNGQVEDGQFVLLEDRRFNSGISQAFVIPENARFLLFTIVRADLNGNGENVPDTLEVALLDRESGLPLLGRIDGLAQTDALVNIQADDTAYFSQGIRVPGTAASGDPADTRVPITVVVDLDGVEAGTVATLHFDLLGFPSISQLSASAETDSVVAIDGISLLGAGQISPLPATTWQRQRRIHW